MLYLLNVHILPYVYHFTLNIVRNHCIFFLCIQEKCALSVLSCMQILQVLFACIHVKSDRPIVHYY